MKLTGKRTYILAFICAIGIAYLWYRTQDTDALFGLIPSSLMFGMRKITANSILNECNQLLKSNKSGDGKQMGISIFSIMGLEKDIADAAGKGQTVLVKFEGDPDVMAFTDAVNKVLADLGQAPIQLKK